MRKEDFSSESSGRLISVGEGRWAFVPDPLPPELAYGPRLVRELSEADRALGELAGLGRTLPNPCLLTQPFLRREAVLSSHHEREHGRADAQALCRGRIGAGSQRVA